ncbi:MAG TPA: MlaD family protein [Thermomonas sp.]|jgi:phospholipid/cholesterol/gamma-HCH transport system substrate-binding protein|uniref:MlaD family protein n=1 Tax=Thermomonas sp. TaxID=1971895 RepID=UPI002B94AD8F|nr:MlaD family protein [Thermomonas sp.]HOZ25283.1 MlaD family protein [Thermomonas sp.]HPW12913.1 MlaD family protein [Thermomonas sp.]
METRANYVLIGGFTLLASIFLLLFALWAAKFSSDRNWREYQVVFSEAVTGLTEGGSVQYNGISVGTVDKLSLVPDDARKVVALLKLKADTPVKVDTRAKLSQQGITGVPFILLSGGSPQAALLEPGPNDEIPIIRTEPSALQNIADTANRLVERMDHLLSEENIRRISATLDNLEQATGSIAGQKEDIAALIVNAREVTDGLKLTVGKANGVIDGVDRNLIARLPALMDRIDSTVAKLDSTAGNANALIAENRPAINSFANDGLAQLGPTLAELRRLIRDLRNLSDRLEDRPASYILGRDAPKEFEPK